MKRSLAILFICTLSLVGCGGDTSTTDTADSGPTPGETVEAFANAMQAGDADELKALCPAFEENLSDNEIDELARHYASRAQANGGIASITIDNEDINGDTATVTATLSNGSGLSDTETFTLNKVNDIWLIDMSKAFRQLDSDASSNEPAEEPEPAAE